MAEALAVVSIVASIIQLTDFGSRVLKRLDEYQSDLGEIPEAFRHVKTQLPVLLDALQQTNTAINGDSTQTESRRALLSAVEGCTLQVKALNDVITKALPVSGDSWARRRTKALGSLRYDAKVERITTVIQGYIQTLTYHAVTSLSSSADGAPSCPMPSSNVPFRRDPHFVDSSTLSEMHRKSGQPASRVALVGLGGVGKSQLAVEYSYQLRDESPDTWVFWVHASNRARFEEGYRKIAERTRLPSWDQPNVDILKLVHMWLCTETNGHWVMIIDNADDIDVFPRSTYKDFHNKDNVGNDVVPSLLELLPQSPNGSILITSRNRNVAFRLTGSYSDIIQVQPMNEAQALALLQKKLDGGFKQEDAMALVEALDYMPLAITQAAAYINQRAPRATVPRYLQDLRKGDRNREKLLEIDIEDSRRDGTSSNSILATWQISFEHILRMKPSATRLLSLMSLFDRQGIPESLLDGHYQRDDDAIFDFEDDLNTLTSYSLVGTDVNGHQFEMHRLVQYSTRKWLDLHGELESWKETYIKLIDNNYPVGQYENRNLSQTLFPHAQATVAYRPAGGSALVSWASVLFKAAWCADDMGNYYIAQELLRGVLEAREVTLGVEHPDTLSSVSKLGIALRNGGKYEEAELMVRRALRGREKVLGLEDPLTLSDLNGLGLVLSERGNYEEAEIFHRQALQAQETILGLKHHSTLQSLSDLGVLLTKRGSYEEAESLHRRGLQIEEVVLGVDHEHTLASMDNLGLVLGKQGKFDEAETMHQQALNGSAKRFGEKHPSTLICARNLACVLGFLEKYEDAESMHRRVLDDSVNVLGNDHPFTLYSFCNLGSVLHAQGKDKEAEVMHQQALASREKILGKEHPHTLSSMHNLATVLKGLRRDQEAVSLMKKCFQLMDEVLGPSHPDTKKSHAILEKWEYESLDAAIWKTT